MVHSALLSLRGAARSNLATAYDPDLAAICSLDPWLPAACGWRRADAGEPIGVFSGLCSLDGGCRPERFDCGQMIFGGTTRYILKTQNYRYSWHTDRGSAARWEHGAMKPAGRVRGRGNMMARWADTKGPRGRDRRGLRVLPQTSARMGHHPQARSNSHSDIPG
jgi:hypothetical protein